MPTITFRLLIYSGIFCLLTTMSGCFSTLPVEIRKIDQLAVSSAGNQADVSFNIMLHNPNNWGFRIVKIQTELSIDQKKLGTVTLPDNLRIRKNADVALPIHIGTTTQELLTILPGSLAALFGSSSMESVVKGNITFGKFIFRKKYPFELKQKIDSKTLQKIF